MLFCSNSAKNSFSTSNIGNSLNFSCDIINLKYDFYKYLFWITFACMCKCKYVLLVNILYVIHALEKESSLFT